MKNLKTTKIIINKEKKNQYEIYNNIHIIFVYVYNLIEKLI